jgi:hypothetical protein
LKIKLALIPLIALLILFAAAPAMAAPVTKTPVSSHVVFITGNVSPGEMRTTEGNILQVRDSISAGNVTGDISGTVQFEMGQTLDLNTGLGVNHGKFVISVAGGGTFEGTFRSMFTGLSFTGTFIGQGTGPLEGKIVMGSYEGQITLIDSIHLVHMDLEGIILEP